MDMYSQPASYGSPQPQMPAGYGMPAPAPAPAPMPAPTPQVSPVPPPATPMPEESSFGSGGGFGGSEPITKEVMMGFVFAFLSGAGIGYIWTQRQQNKFPKLI